ncbi:unnamed protein product, partial [Prunus brigantina]
VFYFGVLFLLFFLVIGPDLLNLFSPTPLQPFHLSLSPSSPLIHPPSFSPFLFPSHELFNLNPFLFHRIFLLLFISYNLS